MLILQVKGQAREIYEQYFRTAEAMPRSVVYKMKKIVQQLEAACAKQITQVKVNLFSNSGSKFLTLDSWMPVFQFERITCICSCN